MWTVFQQRNQQKCQGPETGKGLAYYGQPMKPQQRARGKRGSRWNWKSIQPTIFPFSEATHPASDGVTPTYQRKGPGLAAFGGFLPQGDQRWCWEQNAYKTNKILLWKYFQFSFCILLNMHSDGGRGECLWLHYFSIEYSTSSVLNSTKNIWTILALQSSISLIFKHIIKCYMI